MNTKLLLKNKNSGEQNIKSQSMINNYNRNLSFDPQINKSAKKD